MERELRKLQVLIDVRLKKRKELQDKITAIELDLKYLDGEIAGLRDGQNIVANADDGIGKPGRPQKRA